MLNTQDSKTALSFSPIMSLDRSTPDKRNAFNQARVQAGSGILADVPMFQV
jgi:hypothetical protein